MVKIGFFSQDNNNKIFGGVSTPQIVIKNYFNKPWISIYSCSNKDIGKKAVELFKEQTTSDNNHDVIFQCIKQAGIKKIQIPSNFNNVENSLKKSAYFFKKTITDQEELQTGDILIGETAIAIVLTDGNKIKKDSKNAYLEKTGKNLSLIGTGIKKVKSKRQMFLKSGPGVQYQNIISLSANKDVELLEQSGNWFKIVCPQSQAGYAYGLAENFYE